MNLQQKQKSFFTLKHKERLFMQRSIKKRSNSEESLFI